MRLRFSSLALTLMAGTMLLLSGCQNTPIPNHSANPGNTTVTNNTQAKTYPVSIVTGENSYIAKKGSLLNITLKASGATEQNQLLGLKLTLSGLPSGLQNAKFTVAKDIANQTVRKLDDDKLVLLLYGMRVKKDQELGTLTFDVTEDIKDASVKIYYDQTKDSQKVSELSGTDGTNAGAYVTYPIAEKELFTVKGQ